MAKGKKTGGRDFKPGESGNLNGAPKRENSITHMMKNTIDADKEAIYKKIIELCKKGDQRFVQMFLDRVDGKVKDELIVEGLNVVFNNKSKKEDNNENTD